MLFGNDDGGDNHAEIDKDHDDNPHGDDDDDTYIGTLQIINIYFLLQ